MKENGFTREKHAILERTLEYSRADYELQVRLFGEHDRKANTAISISGILLGINVAVLDAAISEFAPWLVFAYGGVFGVLLASLVTGIRATQLVEIPTLGPAEEIRRVAYGGVTYESLLGELAGQFARCAEAYARAIEQKSLLIKRSYRLLIVGSIGSVVSAGIRLFL